jgi:ATP/maltotriose-dependent transcriptional regulator MalT
MYERLGRYAWVAGQGRASLEAHRTAVGLIPAEPATEARARVLAGLAQILMLQRDYEESRRLADEAIRIALATGARQIEGHALNTRGEDRVHDGEVDEALDDMTAALRIAEEVGNLDDIGRAYANRIDILEVAGRLEEGVAVAEAGVAVARRLGLLNFFGAHYLCNAANLLFRLGRWDDSATAARQAEAIGATGINGILSREVVARLDMARGRLAAADAELRALRPLAAEAADAQVIEPVHAALAELALWQRRPADAASAVADGLALIAEGPDIRHVELYALGLRAQADLAEIARARRVPDAAAVAVGAAFHEAVRGHHARISALPLLAPQATAWMALCDAEARRLRGHADPDAWESVADKWHRLGRPYLAAYAGWRHAEALLGARGDRKLAAEVLRRVVETTDRLGAEPLRQEAEALALRGRLSLVAVAREMPGPPPEDATRLGLTAREREVLALVAMGRTNRQIGEELFISEKTAGVHVSNILGKLGVAGRGEAAAVAHQLGLVDSAAAAPVEAPPG